MMQQKPASESTRSHSIVSAHFITIRSQQSGNPSFLNLIQATHVPFHSDHSIFLFRSCPMQRSHMAIRSKHNAIRPHHLPIRSLNMTIRHAHKAKRSAHLAIRARHLSIRSSGMTIRHVYEAIRSTHIAIRPCHLAIRRHHPVCEVNHPQQSRRSECYPVSPISMLSLISFITYH